MSCTGNWLYTGYHWSPLCADKFAPYTNAKSVYATNEVTGLLLDNGTHVSFGYDMNGVMADKSGNDPQRNTTVSYGWIQENGSQTIADNIAHITGGGSSYLLGVMDNGSVVGVGSNNHGQLGVAADSLTCYWNGNATTPCPESTAASDVWIYLNLGPTQVGP